MRFSSLCLPAGVLQLGYPGFPEVGNFALPTKLLKKGVSDMIRISDARMSGTAYGSGVLHTSPEAAAGGPLALVKNGDMIELDVAKRTLHLDVTKAERISAASCGNRCRPTTRAVGSSSTLST